jgi:predicted kinase
MNDFKKQKVYITKGLPSSGKSTWAKQLLETYKDNTCVRVNNDEIRLELNTTNEIWTPKFEKEVRKVRFERMAKALYSGYDLIVDNTNLNPKTFNSLKTWLIQNFPGVEIIEKSFFDVPVEICIERDKLRGKESVGADVILKMARESGLLKNNIPYPVDPDLPWAIICDLDGTLALFGDRRNPYDASNCDVIDEPNPPVLGILQLYYDIYNVTYGEYGKCPVSKIFFFSGRTDNYKEPTTRFLLNKCGFSLLDPFFELVMRVTGDIRGDEIIKEEMFDKHIRNQYNVYVVIDDRPKVCRKWHSMGLPVFNVGDGEEF